MSHIAPPSHAARAWSNAYVSIVIATYRRFERLRRCVEHIRRDVRAPHELVIVDGGSDDGTAEWLAAQPDIRTHIEKRRGGCCHAYNLGFRLACGSHVMWLNDDAYPLPGAVENALALLERPDLRDVGMAAFYHNHQQPWNELHGVDHDGRRFGILHVRGVPYANFGLLRRELLERVGFLDGRYQFCGWDPDLSLKIQREAGLKVVGSPGALVYHEELIDARKQDDVDHRRACDNEFLFRKWKLPEKGAFPDPRPAYAEMLRVRGVERPAAVAS